MNITDINGSDGPFWALYQETRRRDNILDNPDSVPFWFLEKLARERLAAARVGLEQLGTRDHASQEAWAALRTLETSLGAGMDLDDREQIVLGILGAQEEETRRELEEAGVSERFVGCRACRRELGSNDACDTCLGARTACWLGRAFEDMFRTVDEGRSPVLPLAKALYQVIQSPVSDISKDWHVALPRVVRFWGGTVPLSQGPLALSKAAVDAWLAQRGRTSS